MPLPTTIDLEANGGVLRLRTPEQIRELITTEIGFWEPLRAEARNANQNTNNVLSPMADSLNQHLVLLRGVMDLSNNGRVDEAIATLPSALNNRGFPTTFSTRGAIITEVVSSMGLRAALGAFAAVVSVKFDGNDPAMVRGFIAANHVLENTGRLARRSVQTGLAQLVERASTQQRRIEDLVDQFEADFTRLRIEHRARVGRILRSARRVRNRITAEVLESTAGAVASIQETERVYTEHMALKGPVTYWRDKAAEHRKKAQRAQWVGLAFAAAIVLYVFLYGATQLLQLVEHAILRTGQWQVAYVVLTLAVLVLTVAFWIGRLISRTYVSETHLAIDAEERATLTQTYLALANENKISEGERVLVLAALFRASSDGLVRDDAAPDMSLPGLASRILTSPPTAAPRP